jgi:hypothetical protein
MKRVVIGLACAFFVFGVAGKAGAWPFGKKKDVDSQETAAAVEEKAAPAKTVKPDAKALDEAAKQRRATQQKKLAELNNTEWQIELTPLGGKGKKETDVVTFKNNQVSVASYAKKGFVPTNFTLTVQDDGMVVWETMQSSEKAGTAFWRGEMSKDMQVVNGILSYQLDAKTKTDYSFVSTAKKNIPAGGS